MKIFLLLTKKGLTHTQTIADFFKIWSGVVLLAEKTEHSGEKNYTALKRVENWNNIKVPVFFVGLVASFILLALKGFYTTNNSSISNFSLVFYKTFFTKGTRK